MITGSFLSEIGDCPAKLAHFLTRRAKVTWTAKGGANYFSGMLPMLISVVVEVALFLGAAFILSTVPSMPTKVSRFVFLFVLCMPLVFVINYLDVRLLGYPEMGLTAASIIGLLSAAFGTFLPRQRHNSNPP